MTDWRKVSRLLRCLQEKEVACPSFGDFFVDERGVEEAIWKAAEPDEEGFSVIVYVMSKEPMPEEKIGFRLDDIELHCPDLIRQLGSHIESIVHDLGSGEVGEIEDIRGPAGKQVVYSAPVIALFDEAECGGLVDTRVEPDGRVSLGFGIWIPTEVGEFRYAYP
jgi:hypothetical protein